MKRRSYKITNALAHDELRDVGQASRPYDGRAVPANQ
jgi:hypothetical protein